MTLNVNSDLNESTINDAANPSFKRFFVSRVPHFERINGTPNGITLPSASPSICPSVCPNVKIYF